MFDYITGDVAPMNRRVAEVLPAWSRELPGHHAVRSMQAFALEEAGAFGRAEETALAALAQDPLDARACHVMAHVFEMTDRPAAGVRWMAENAARWSGQTVVATHGHWHVALFHLALGDIDKALDIYDSHVRPTGSMDVADLIDASALLWRTGLVGGNVQGRWIELAAAWAARVDDRFCSFSDLHAMLAFVGADDAFHAQRLERALQDSASRPTRHGETTRLLGLPACRAVRAFGRGDDALATRLLAGLPSIAHRLGGSHAQRDVLTLTLRRAAERSCRSTRRVAARRPVVARSLVAGCAPFVAAGDVRGARP